MPLQQTSGNVTADAFGGGVAVIPTYIEQIFSTYLYTGNSSTQTITNGIDLAGKGGMTWIKCRTNAYDHEIFDTARGINKYIIPNKTVAQDAYGAYTDLLTSFDSTGFTLGADASNIGINRAGAGQTYASWTFRKQPKFFDVVTYTGTDGGSGTDSKTITHNLASTPGCIFVKRIDADPSAWKVWHTSTTDSGLLNTTGAFGTSSGLITSPRNEGYISAATNTTFTVSPGGGNNFQVNSNGGLYVAYLFAHNAGGFGLTGTDNVVSCGSFTTDGSGNASVNLGYEPQWLMVKASSTTGNWQVIDNMRGFSKTGYEVINANTSGAAIPQTSPYYDPSATGFSTTGIYAPSTTIIYIAIRRGPMKVPTDATSVYNAVTWSGNDAGGTLASTFSPDLYMCSTRTGTANNHFIVDRLRAPTTTIYSNYPYAEVGGGAGVGNIVFNQTSVSLGATIGADTGSYDVTGDTYINHFFKRAPSFFDEVCYTGTGSATTVAHNLAKVPELMIVKSRSASANWNVYAAPIWQGSGNFNVLTLNSTSPDGTYNNTIFNSTAPTASVFSIGSVAGTINDSGATYVAYLFATCPGVSKVGSYTGNGTTQTINCGFAAGARFVLIKRTDATGGWYVYDTARGMTVLTDPYLLLNSTALEVATFGSVTTVTTGFALNSAITAAINVSGGSYIYFSVA